MKKTIILLFIFSSMLCKSQITPWINQGATWVYIWGNIGTGGYEKIEYTHDTIILGKTCEILKTTSYSYAQPGPGLPIILISTKDVGNRYTYSNVDTVFYLNNNKFNILYNFGSHSNDKWNLGIDTNGAYCSRSIVKVDSVSLQTINSNVQRVLYTSDSANSTVGIIGKIIEHIGSMNYLFPTGRNCDPKIVVDFNIYNFYCFHDVTMSYVIPSSGDCQNPLHVGIAELTRDPNTIQCFPNPVETNLNIIFSDGTPYLVSIYNALGEKVIETKNQKK